MKEHFEEFALYNKWANEKLYSFLSTDLDEAELNRDLGAFFGTIMGTLNHLLVGDFLWMGRLDGLGPTPKSLDTVLHEDLASLSARREEADTRLINITSSLTDDRLQTILEYTTSQGIHCRDKLADIMGHIFNHQTHHRGQIHQMISQIGYTPPPLDRIYLIREKSERS
ncbi:MAG: DinB family protein [Sneathiellales bacterium]|nr:DinB family protein [Sneathiellales bacterium]